jgi:universal stress protein E
LAFDPRLSDASLARQASRDRVHLHQGGTRDGLIALADRVRADVVVMGAVSRRGLSRVFIGNTAEDVLDKIGCDILVVKTPSLAAKLKQ